VGRPVSRRRAFVLWTHRSAPYRLVGAIAHRYRPGGTAVGWGAEVISSISATPDRWRAAALGIVPVPQGRFVSEPGDGMLAALVPERARTCYRMRTLLDAGMVLPGSSDAPDGLTASAVAMRADRVVHEGCRRVQRVERILRSWRAGSSAC
jgi:hypothetical protein